MSEQAPPPEESDDQTAKSQPARPEVPVPDDFEVTSVVRFPEDPDERRRVREEFDNRPSARIDLTDTGVGRPAASRGHKGGSRKPSE